MRIEVLIDVKTVLGEGPLWDVDEQRLYFIDSFGCNVFRCTADGREVRAWDVPAKIGSMALRRQGGAVVSLANGFHFLDFKTGDCQLIVDPESDKPANRINDGKVDKRGRFIAGSMDTMEDGPNGALYWSALDPGNDWTWQMLQSVFPVNGTPPTATGTAATVIGTLLGLDLEFLEALADLSGNIVSVTIARVNRLGMMGELAASLAHEITQPIAAGRNNARAALEFPETSSRQTSREVREALGCVVGDADRAGQIVDRIRDHIKNAPPRKHLFDLNEAIGEVIVLARSAIAENGVSVQTLPDRRGCSRRGDRVQLQQVVLNLTLNATEAMSAVDEGARELLISSEQAGRTTSPSRCAILARALIRNISSAFSTLSTPRSPAGWGWGCRSAGPSSKLMAAGCGLTQTSPECRIQFTLPSAEMTS